MIKLLLYCLTVGLLIMDYENISLKPEELLNAILASSPDGYIACDEFGKLTYINEVVEKLSGWSNKDLLGEETNKLYSLPESVSKDLQRENHIKQQPVILTRNDGKKLHFKAKQVRIQSTDANNKSFKGYLIIVRTESSLNSTVDRAQVEFVSTVSHELRTPLTSIRGFAETLIRSADRLTEENKKKYITIIKEQADRLTRLVEDLLAVSRLESQNYQLTVRSLDLKKYINKACDILSAKSSKHKIVQEIEDTIPNVWADADRLEQILTNLIDNAIKYSPDGGEVKIKVYSTENECGIKDKLKIEVSDQGVGISEDDLPKIFTKFGRLDNPLTRQTQGTGLGLFITKSLVLALKGDINVQSKSGGTTFNVILPAVLPDKGIPLSNLASFDEIRLN